MLELGSVFAVAQKLLEVPQAKAAAVGVLSWIGEKVFPGKKETQEKLKQLSEADGSTLANLQAKLEFVLEDNEGLRQELLKKVSELEELLKKSGTELPATVQQVHYGQGDNVGRDKIVGK